MNKVATLCALAVGGTFFAVGSIFYYRPAFMTDYSLETLLATNPAKARVAVSRLLFDPGSAVFSAMRSVQDEAEKKYVCGHVDAKDRSGIYAGNRAFVYTASADFARIDDDGRIARKHDAFKDCPVSADGKTPPLKLEISPQALEMAKAIQQVMPKSDEASLPGLLAQMPSTAAAVGAMPVVGAVAGVAAVRTGAAAGQGASTVSSGSTAPSQSMPVTLAGLDNEHAWRGDRPPRAWPHIPPEHPLAKPARKRSHDEAVTFAKDVEKRWTSFKAGKSKTRPSPGEINEALRALLAVDPHSEKFPQAWASFVMLRQIEREASV